MNGEDYSGSGSAATDRLSGIDGGMGSGTPSGVQETLWRGSRGLGLDHLATIFEPSRFKVGRDILRLFTGAESLLQTLRQDLALAQWFGI